MTSDANDANINKNIISLRTCRRTDVRKRFKNMVSFASFVSLVEIYYVNLLTRAKIPPILPSPCRNADAQRAEGTGGTLLIPPVSLPFLIEDPHKISFIIRMEYEAF